MHTPPRDHPASWGNFLSKPPNGLSATIVLEYIRLAFVTRKKERGILQWRLRHCFPAKSIFANNLIWTAGKWLYMPIVPSVAHSFLAQAAQKRMFGSDACGGWSGRNGIDENLKHARAFSHVRVRFFSFFYPHRHTRRCILYQNNSFLKKFLR